jgi:hypothetical protein
MKNESQINKLIDEALNSLDGAGSATPRPYLFTRLNARMQNAKENTWDNVLSFISKPTFAFASLCLVIAINATVVAYHYNGSTTTVTEEAYAAVDEYSSGVTVLNEIVNIER